MKKFILNETEETDNCTETDNFLENTPSGTSDSEKETSSFVSVTFEEAARQIKAVTDPLTQPLTHLCELMQELRNERAH